MHEPTPLPTDRHRAPQPPAQGADLPPGAQGFTPDPKSLDVLAANVLRRGASPLGLAPCGDGVYLASLVDDLAQAIARVGRTPVEIVPPHPLRASAPVSGPRRRAPTHAPHPALVDPLPPRPRGLSPARGAADVAWQLVDLSGLEHHGDLAAVARHLATTVLVARAGVTRERDLASTRVALVDADLWGVILIG